MLLTPTLVQVRSLLTENKQGEPCYLWSFIQPEPDRLFDLGRESPYFFSVEVEGGPYGYIAMLGENYHEVLKNYYSVTGFPALPPLCSALGSLAPL